MEKAKASDFEMSLSKMQEDEDEDEETLAAIDEGIRDVRAGRVVPASKVRKLLTKWTRQSSKNN